MDRRHKSENMDFVDEVSVALRSVLVDGTEPSPQFTEGASGPAFKAMLTAANALHCAENNIPFGIFTVALMPDERGVMVHNYMDRSLSKKGTTEVVATMRAIADKVEEFYAAEEEFHNTALAYSGGNHALVGVHYGNC